MSAENGVAEARMMCCASADMCCASCGKLDVIQFKKCDDCDLVRYCSDKCQQDHRPQHAAMCKERAAELRDKILFRQPESSYLRDCPICLLPLSLYPKQSTMMGCCSKVVCKGCMYADEIRQLKEQRHSTCPFCRKQVPNTPEEGNANTKKRAEKNDPVAMTEIGKKHYIKGDYECAIEYWTNASKLGNADAHSMLGSLYGEGEGVEKDEKKELYHLEVAAIGGHPNARHNVGAHELRNCRIERAVKHWVIAASLGYDISIQALKSCYTGGHVSKEDFAAALRAHQAAVDATKSPQREEALKVLTAIRH